MHTYIYEYIYIYIYVHLVYLYDVYVHICIMRVAQGPHLSKSGKFEEEDARNHLKVWALAWGPRLLLPSVK